MNKLEEAIKFLQENSITAESRAFGFSLLHTELTKGDFAQCGIDNDSSISLSVAIDEAMDIGEDVLVKWFFRMDYIEMAEFIMAAYQATGEPNPSRVAIVMSMRDLDKLYDDTELENMTEQFLTEI